MAASALEVPLQAAGHNGAVRGGSPNVKQQQSRQGRMIREVADARGRKVIGRCEGK